ncbi:hypothetical protein D3C81_1083160 [compost metagenome]
MDSLADAYCIMMQQHVIVKSRAILVSQQAVNQLTLRARRKKSRRFTVCSQLKKPLKHMQHFKPSLADKRTFCQLILASSFELGIQSNRGNLVSCKRNSDG